jgi:flagellar motor protein MotB
MTSLHVPRWAVSFADLTMLLLAFFVLLQAGNSRTVAAGARAAFANQAAAPALLDAPARRLFERGEARLTARARRDLLAIGRGASRSGKLLVVESEGHEPSGGRFDAWELAAARAASLARALGEGGLGEEEITILMPRSGKGEAPSGQKLTVRPSG